MSNRNKETSPAVASNKKEVSRSRAFMSNTFWSLLLQVVTLAVGFIVPQVIIKVYGSETNGLVSSLTQFVSYISLVEAGISAAAVFALYDPISRGDAKGVSVVVSSAKRFYYKSGFLFTVAALALAVLYPLLIDLGGLSPSRVFVLVLSLCATGFLDFFTLAKYRVLLTADQKNWVIQIATIIYKILYAIVVVVVASLGVSVEIVYLAAIVPIVIRSVVLIVYTRRVFPEVDFCADSSGFNLPQRWDALYLQILGAIQNGAPIIIATFVTDSLSMVSVFSIYLLVANGVRNAVSSVTQGTQASFGDVIARGQSETLRAAFSEFQVVSYTATAVLCSVAFVLIMPFITLYTSGIDGVRYYYTSIGFLCIFEVLLYHLKTPQGLLVIAAGMYRETRVQTTIQAALLLLCSTVLGLQWGVPGILAGVCISDLYRTVDLIFFVPARITGTKPRHTIKLIGLCLLGCLITCAPFMAIGVSCRNWFEWLAWGVAVGVWGLVACFAMYALFARTEITGLVERVKRMLHRS